jgi:hypothetical protein
MNRSFEDKNGFYDGSASKFLLMPIFTIKDIAKISPTIKFSKDG